MRAGFVADVDADGNRFNPNKLLFDPYARELSHDRETPEMKELHGIMPACTARAGPLHGLADAAPAGAAARVRHRAAGRRRAWSSTTDSSFGDKPRIPQKDAVIYEAHVRGLTRHPSSTRLSSHARRHPGFEAVENVPDELRGTYAGAGYMAKYLQRARHTPPSSSCPCTSSPTT